MIKLQFSRSTENVSKLIAWACRSPFSHVDYVMEDGNLLLGASDSPHAPYIEGNPGGVAIRPPDYQPFAIRRIASIYVPARVETRFDELMRSQLGEPFDSHAMHAVFKPDNTGHRDWRDASAWFCSELKAWGLEEAGAFDVPPLVSKDRVTPADLLLMVSHLVSNAETFYQPIPGLILGPQEE
jgi:hypothetical protein